MTGTTVTAIPSAVGAGRDIELVTDQRINPPSTDAMTLSQILRSASSLGKSVALIPVSLLHFICLTQSHRTSAFDNET
jgi:hypothetical protein